MLNLSAIVDAWRGWLKRQAHGGSRFFRPGSPKVFAVIGLAAAMLTGCAMVEEEPIDADQGQQRLAEAIELASIYDYAGAIAQLEPVMPAFQPGTEEWSQACYVLASAYRYREPVGQEGVEKSRALFARIRDESSNHNLIALSLLELAREAELENYSAESADLPRARQLYRTVMADYPGSAFSAEAAIRLANTYFTLESARENLEQGAGILQNYLQEYPDNPLSVVMWQQLGLANQRISGDAQAALQNFERAEELGFAVPTKKDNQLWVMAQLAEKTDDVQLAARLYQAILTETPRAGEGSFAKERLKEIAREHPEWSLVIPERQTFSSRRPDVVGQDPENQTP
ncbi:MAG: hypothetical protein AAGK14_04735 [Verrucomicrobiota bacterium]